MRFANVLPVGLLLLATLVAAPAALAQTQLDAPALQVVEESRVSVALNVEAGASGAPAGFVVEWMKKVEFDALGGWPEAGDPRIHTAMFDGIPTLNPSTGSYVLGSSAYVEIELGDLFDETGVTASYVEELGSGEEVVVRARAAASPEANASDYSTVVVARTQSLPVANCTYTIGFWKTHFDQWPVGSLTLGTVNYTAAQLLDILNEPAAGNGLLILAHQLIAAKLNIANGADPTPIASAVSDADALIDGLVCPPIGAGSLPPGSVTSLKDELDDYNNGLSGVPHCGVVPAQPATWGRMKSAYR
jgi:hypothetical protein